MSVAQLVENVSVCCYQDLYGKKPWKSYMLHADDVSSDCWNCRIAGTAWHLLALEVTNEASQCDCLVLYGLPAAMITAK